MRQCAIVFMANFDYRGLAMPLQQIVQFCVQFGPWCVQCLAETLPTFLVLDFALHVINRVRALHFQSNGLASECFHEDLHASSEPEYQVKRWLFLNIVVSQSASVLQLFASKDQPLLVRRNTCKYEWIVREGDCHLGRWQWSVQHRSSTSAHDDPMLIDTVLGLPKRISLRLIAENGSLRN